jgi:hypothetical protein
VGRDWRTDGFCSVPCLRYGARKAGSRVAQHLAHAYKEYLAVFENVYVSTIMDSLWKNHALTAAQRPMAMGSFGGNHGPGGRSGGIADPSQMQLAIAHANFRSLSCAAAESPSSLSS